MFETKEQIVAHFTAVKAEWDAIDMPLEDFQELIAETVADAHPDAFAWLGVEPPAYWVAKKRAVQVKTAFFYLVTSSEDGQLVWKWGITTKPNAKARSSSYSDTHRWVEITSMAVGRRIEKLMGCLMVNVLNDRERRSMYDESVPQSFPFEVLLQMVDWALANVDDAGRWSAEADPLYQAACPGLVGYADAAPEIALQFRALMGQAMVPVRSKELEPMWA